MPRSYYSLTVELPEQSSEDAQALLHGCGALGLEVRDGEAPLMPGVRVPRSGEAIVIGFFEGAKAARRAQSLACTLPGARVTLAKVPSEDWSKSWRARIKSVQVGRLWVGPPWAARQAPRGKVRITIEPKMAFGTGDHPTTALCLKAVDAFLSEHPGASVLDVGTGTGILAIAARKLGAGRVVGIDNDPTSVELARETARKNRAERVHLSGRPLSAIRGRFDLVVANILANTLCELAPALGLKARQRVVLAGILTHQAAQVERRYRREGLRLVGTETEGEWIRLDFAPPSARRGESV